MRAHFLEFVECLALLSSTMGFAQADHPNTPEKLGSVTFSTSCSSTERSQFNRAVALMHSFQFARAIETFHTVLSSDPSCSMAYWGIALSSWGNPFATGLKPRAQLEQGLRAVTQARAANPKTARERAYVEAVAHLYTGAANTDQRSRVLAYESAMAAVSAAYPEDTEAAIFYALALAEAADPADKTYARQLKAGKRGRSALRSTTVRLPHRLRTHYTCRRIHLHDSEIGRLPSMPISRLPLLHEARVSRSTSCMPAITSSMHICRLHKTAPPCRWFNPPFRYSRALIRRS